MSNKLQIGLIIVTAACLATTVSFGELFSFQPPAGTPASTKAQPSPVLSASDFKSKVSTMGQQAQQQMLQQSQGNLKASASQMTLPNSPPQAPKIGQPATTPTDTSQSSNASSSQSKTAAVPTPDASEQAEAPAPVAQPMPPSHTSQPAAALSAPSSPPVASPQESQVYTGFGSSNGNSSNSSSGSSTTSQSSGGWNVKY